MIDDIVNVFRIGVLFVFVYHTIKIGRSKKMKASDAPLFWCLLGISLFLSGIEMVTHSETPWSFLLEHGTQSDWLKALIGGVAMFALPAALAVLFRKEMAKYLGRFLKG